LRATELFVLCFLTSLAVGTPVEALILIDDSTGNGGFEDGTGQSFDQIDFWFNYPPINVQQDPGRNNVFPFAGTFRGILQGGAFRSPAQDTEYPIMAGDEFDLSFRHAAASNWLIGEESITATLYYLDDGSNPVDIDSITVIPSQDVADGYDLAEESFAPIPAESAAIGRNLLVRFEANAVFTSFAALDEVRLTVPESSASLQLLAAGLAVVALRRRRS
jgi:hypothetical protein